MPRYRNGNAQASVEFEPVHRTLQEMILGHLSEWVPKLVENEIQEHLGREWYEHHRSSRVKQYRNGYHKERPLTCGSGTFPVRLPRLREPFESEIVERYRRSTEEIGEVLPELYLHGLATGDFRDALGPLLGEEAPLSASTIVRLKKEWEEQYRMWRQRPLEREYLYVWADGVYPKAGPVDERLAVLVVVGLNRKGRKEIQARLDAERGLRLS